MHGHTLRSSSSLPSLRTSASLLRTTPSTAAMIALPMHTSTGSSRSTSDDSDCARHGGHPTRLVRPGLNLHRAAGGQGGDADGAARRAVVAEAGDVGLVERREGVHVGEEAQRLGDVGQRGARRWPAEPAGSRSPGGLGGDAAVDQRAVLQAELTADDDPVTGADNGGIRTERFAHVGIVRATSSAAARLLHRPRCRCRGAICSPAPGRWLVAGRVRRRLVRLRRRPTERGSGHDRVHGRPALPEQHVRARQGAPADLAGQQGSAAARRARRARPAVCSTATTSDRHGQRADPLEGHRHPLLGRQRRDRPARHLHTCASTATTATARRSWSATRRRSRCRCIGSLLPPFDTPTVDNHRGVEPYCTLTPSPCPLHDVTLTAGVRSRQAGGVHGRHAGALPDRRRARRRWSSSSSRTQRVGDKIVMVHAEVYSDNAGDHVAPAVARARTGLRAGVVPLQARRHVAIGST